MESTAPCCIQEPHIRVSSLDVTFGATQALRDVNLVIPRGCITAIVGPSGSGKSSLLSVFNRMTDRVPDCSVSGRVEIDGIDVLGKDIDVRALRRSVGLIFQRPTPLPLSIADNVLLPLDDHAVGTKSDRRAILERVLHDVGLWDQVAHRLRSPASTLSGGQQQRLCIARCLALSPQIVLFDEPCSALDPIATERIESLIYGMRGRFTIVLVTHNLAQARRIADETVVVWSRPDRSSVVECGPTRRIFEQPRDELTDHYISGITG